MESFGKFSRELNRMPKNKRSSLNDNSINHRNFDYPCDTSCKLREQSYQPYADSPYPSAQNMSKLSQAKEDPTPKRETNRRARYIESGFPDSDRDPPMRPMGIRRAEPHVILQTNNGSKKPLSSRRVNFDSVYNSSGQPLNLSDRPPTSQARLQRYNTSGRPLTSADIDGNGTELMPREEYEQYGAPGDGSGAREGNLQAPYNESGRVFNLKEFVGSAFETPIDSNYYPRRVSETTAQIPAESDNAPSQPHNFKDVITRTPPSKPHFGRARDFTCKTPIIQVQSNSYDSPIRPLNLSVLSGRQTRTLQDSYKTPGRLYNIEELSQDGGQYLQVPRELYTRSGNQLTREDLSQTLQVPFEQCKYSGHSPTGPLPNIQDCPSQSQSIKGRQPCQGTTDRLNRSQEQLIQFLLKGDVNQIQSKQSSSPLFDTLVKDNYYPGVIEDAVNGKIDFNKIAFDAVFNSDNIPSELQPEEVPMTLLEAFEMRIQYEKDLQENPKKSKVFCRQKYKRKGSTVKEEAETFRSHRDELKLASTVDIDLTSNIRDYPETALTKAIACLFRAEKMNDFDKDVHLAEKAIRSASPGHHEEAALKSTCPFQIDMPKDEVTYNPIEIISYLGTTYPSD